jgi:hypothetical protein
VAIDLLLHFDTDFSDSSVNDHVIDIVSGTPTILTTGQTFGVGCYSGGLTRYYVTPPVGNFTLRCRVTIPIGVSTPNALIGINAVYADISIRLTDWGTPEIALIGTSEPSSPVSVSYGSTYAISIEFFGGNALLYVDGALVSSLFVGEVPSGGSERISFYGDSFIYDEVMYDNTTALAGGASSYTVETSAFGASAIVEIAVTGNIQTVTTTNAITKFSINGDVQIVTVPESVVKNGDIFTGDVQIVTVPESVVKNLYIFTGDVQIVTVPESVTTYTTAALGNISTLNTPSSLIKNSNIFSGRVSTITAPSAVVSTVYAFVGSTARATIPASNYAVAQHFIGSVTTNTTTGPTLSLSHTAIGNISTLTKPSALFTLKSPSLALNFALENKSFTTFSNHDFVGSCVFGGKTLFISDAGLFEAGGLTDNNAPIVPSLKTGKMDTVMGANGAIHSHKIKRLPDSKVYIDADKTGGAIDLTITADTSTNTYNNAVTHDGFATHAIKVGRGIKYNYVQLEIIGNGCSRLDIGSIRYNPIEIQRSER